MSIYEPQGPGHSDAVLIFGSSDAGYVAEFQGNWGGQPIGTGGPLGVGDLNGDGFADLVVGTGLDFFILYGGQAKLTPGADAETLNLPGFSAANRVVVQDLDGDGISDIALSGEHSAYLLFQSPDGGFLGTTLSSPLANPSDQELGGLVQDLAVGDFLQGPGRTIVQVISQENLGTHQQTGFWDVFDAPRDEGLGDAGQYAEVDIPESGPQGAFVAVADLDGDGWPDLVDNCAVVHWGQADGGLSGAQSFSSPPGTCLGLDVAVADLGDGRPALVLTHGDGTFSTLYVARDGGVELASYSMSLDGVGTDAGTSGLAVFLAAGDLNGDGAPDIAVTNPESMTLFLNQCPP